MKKVLGLTLALALGGCITTEGMTPQERIELIRSYVQLTCAIVPTAAEVAEVIKGKPSDVVETGAKVCDVITKKRAKVKRK